MLLALSLASLCACARQDDANEARLFLERYDAVLRGGDEQRATRVERLRELPILNDEIRRVRDRCVEVQLAILRAQRLSAEAGERVTALEADGGTATAADRRNIEALLAQAEAATRTVEQGMHACSDGVSSVRAHHGRDGRP